MQSYSVFQAATTLQDAIRDRDFSVIVICSILSFLLVGWIYFERWRLVLGWIYFYFERWRLRSAAREDSKILGWIYFYFERWRLRSAAREDSKNEVFVGVKALRRDEVNNFHGRHEELNKLFERVKANRFVVVCGNSGTGKSSLLQAGLLGTKIDGGNRLDASSTKTLALYVNEWSNPKQALIHAFRDQYPKVFPQPPTAEHPLPVVRNLADLLSSLGEINVAVLVICDQFERAPFSRNKDTPDELTDFIRGVCGLDKGHVVIGIRKEWFSDLRAFADLSPLLSVFWLDDLKLADAADVLKDMVRGTKLAETFDDKQFREKFLGDLLNDDDRISLAELKIIGSVIERNENIRTYASYVIMGGKEGLLQHYIEDIIKEQKLDRHFALEILVALSVQENTREPLTLAELARIVDRDADDVRKILNKLKGVGKPVSDAGELTHDILAKIVISYAREELNPIEIENVRFFWNEVKKRRGRMPDATRLGVQPPKGKDFDRNILRIAYFVLIFVFVMHIVPVLSESTSLSGAILIERIGNLHVVPAIVAMAFAAEYVYQYCRNILALFYHLESGFSKVFSAVFRVVHTIGLVTLVFHPEWWMCLGGVFALLIGIEYWQLSLYRVSARKSKTLDEVLRDRGTSSLVSGLIWFLAGIVLTYVITFLDQEPAKVKVVEMMYLMATLGALLYGRMGVTNRGAEIIAGLVRREMTPISNAR